ncbi:MAG: rhamnogalacturonan acetylesterase [Gammaproteobacteria bacterium]|nr:rhamnogalacturonan acetylesterase [Gammaproteobacteria bacterium]
MIRLLLLYILFVFSIVACGPEKTTTIYLIGDSTMSDKIEPERNPERGWGQMLPTFFDGNVKIENHAVNGRSTKSFIDQQKWDAVLNKIQPGDYVFIQFGHNDQKNKDPARYTNPYTGYRRNLIKYINETRSKGGIPVLFTSIVRRNFNEFGVLEDTHGAYPFIVRDVARELSVPLVDMQLKSEDLVLALGEEKSKQIYLWVEPGTNEMLPAGKQDNTHFNEKGATELARLAVEGLKEIDLPITEYIKTN